MSQPEANHAPFPVRFSPDELTALRPLQQLYPTLDAAVDRLVVVPGRIANVVTR